MRNTMLHFQLEQDRGWQEFRDNPQFFELPPGYKISVIPPVTLADARFLVKRPDGRTISVYLDLKENLGCFGGPHWEVYPDRDGSNSRCAYEDMEELVRLITWAPDAGGGEDK